MPLTQNLPTIRPPNPDLPQQFGGSAVADLVGTANPAVNVRSNADGPGGRESDEALRLIQAPPPCGAGIRGVG